MKKLYALAFIWLLAFSNLYAFDGERKGFILGGGIGAGFLSNTESFNSLSNTDSRIVFLANGKIGYAPSNTLEIYSTGKQSWWGKSGKISRLLISAIAITVYFDNTTETVWFISGGFGLFGGGGYEFSSHWSLELNLLYSTITKEETDFNSIGVLVTVNFLAF